MSVQYIDESLLQCINNLYNQGSIHYTTHYPALYTHNQCQSIKIKESRKDRDVHSYFYRIKFTMFWGGCKQYRRENCWVTTSPRFLHSSYHNESCLFIEYPRKKQISGEKYTFEMNILGSVHYAILPRSVSIK